MKKKPLIALWLSLLLIPSVAAIVHFQLEQNARITVLENPWQLVLYTDEACTTPAPTITFPSIYENDVNSEAIESPAYYLKFVNQQNPPLNPVSMNWNATDNPTGCTISGYCKEISDTSWSIMYSETTYFWTLSNVRMVKFTVTVEGLAQGEYDFNIVFDSGN